MEKTKHAHAVIDQDLPFVIDPITKEVQTQGLNPVVPQHAKNSERFTFTIPDRYIEGHDMSLVNQAFVHFRNVGTQGQLSAGIYKVKDLAVADDSVTLSWLIDDDATYYVGALIFSIHFICTDESGEVVYDLPTLAYTKVSVGETVWNSEEIVAKYPDIIAELESRISAVEAGGAESTQKKLVSWEIAEAGNTVTLNYTLEGEDKHTDVITFNADGHPVSLVHDGFEATGTWSEVSDG